MKIKTITCHEVYNYGATLQEYALLEYLKQMGYDAETIHYKPKYLSGHFNLWAISNPKYNKPFIKQLYLIAKLFGRIKSLKKKKRFDQFHEKFIPTTKKLYVTNDELISDLPKADAYICGSDQIWNSYFENGKDPAFYLNFVPGDKKKISYAASFAIDKIEEHLKPFVRENILRLDAVSVRESSGVDILNDLGIEKKQHVLDPVFLLDKEHWEKFVFPMPENFVFVYDFDNNEIIKKTALKYKQERGWKIYTINANINYADKNFWLEGPETFLSLVKNAQIHLGNSFHGLAFSLIFEKQFAIFNRSEKINTRMADLLSLFDLQRFLFVNESDLSIISNIDYKEVKNKIQSNIETSKDFLLNSINI